jgi:dTDP-4-amino-4,6-dideoxygalactose transaminase
MGDKSFYGETMPKTIPPVRLYFPKEDIEEIKISVEKILQSGMLTLHTYTKEFENQFAKLCNVKNTIAVNSGTSALEIALRTIKLKPEHEVLVPTNTFSATAAAIIFAGAKPKLTDIDPKTLCIDTENIQKNITSKTKGVMVVHIGGLICPEIEEIKELCQDRKLFLIEDAAHAHGSTINQKPAGSFGDAGCFCLPAETLIHTANGENVTIQELCSRNNIVGLEVMGMNEDLEIVPTKVLAVHTMKLDDYWVCFRTRIGTELKLTSNHRIPCLRDGVIQWIRASELKRGDFVATPRSLQFGGREIASGLSDSYEELFYLAGLVASDGHIHIGRHSLVGFSNTDEDLVNAFVDGLIKCFGKVPIDRRKISKNVEQVRVTRRSIAEIFYQINSNILSFDQRRKNLWLKGFSDGDGGFSLQERPGRSIKGVLTFSTMDPFITSVVRTLLLEISIFSSVITRRSKRSKEKRWQLLQVTNPSPIIRFSELIGFRQRQKAERMKRYLSLVKVSKRSNVDLIPLGESLRDTRRLYGVHHLDSVSDGYLSLLERGKHTPTRIKTQELCMEIESKVGNSIALSKLAHSDVLWDRIEDIETIKGKDGEVVYDLTTQNGTFIANFIVVHNSFYPTKVMTTGEGGMITTNNEEMAEKALILRDQGKENFNSNIIIELGYNWRLPEISAAIGITQLKRLPEIIEKRNRIAKYYDKGLEKITGIKPLKTPSNIRNNYYKYVAFLEEGINRDKLKEKLKVKGVRCSGEVYWPPLHLQPIYKQLLGTKEGDFPQAEDACKRMICLPLYAQMTIEEAQYVIGKLRETLSQM